MAFASPFGGTIAITDSGLEITFGTINFNKNPEAYRDLLGLMGDASDFGFDGTLTSAAMLAATAVLSAKGTKREMVPAPAKLNTARAKTNKPPIPQHVVIRSVKFSIRMAKRMPLGMDRRVRTFAEGISGNKRKARSTASAKRSLSIRFGSTMCRLMTRQRRRR
jgi:hypothetical protein